MLTDLKQTKEFDKWLKANEESLTKQSRSFAIPVLNLDERFRFAVMVEYNLNKIIDTIEDNEILTIEEKIANINEFIEYFKQGKTSSVLQKRLLRITPDDESFVFRNYPATIALYNTLSNTEKKLSLDATTEMAQGMCEFLQKEIKTPSQLNRYCYYVAGTVGIYLTKLLALKGSGMSDEITKKLENESIAFGLFLQKLNVIRDFVEDKEVKQRHFWPRDYFIEGQDRVDILNLLCDETLTNDLPKAIKYWKTIPTGNESYDYFIRFILKSGMEYLTLLRGNQSVFSRAKVKLSGLFIKSLYKNIAAQSKEDFLEYCENYLG